jgi:hypothetical protein
MRSDTRACLWAAISVILIEAAIVYMRWWM